MIPYKSGVEKISFHSHSHDFTLSGVRWAEGPGGGSGQSPVNKLAVEVNRIW